MGISKAEGLVLQIQRMSTEDGPGLRTTAFLKGCPLSCAWCHNPESIAARPELQWIGSRCIAASASAATAKAAADPCGACIASCPSSALGRDEMGSIVIDRGRCTLGEKSGVDADGTNCFEIARCAEACPGGAMELLGTRYSAEALARELLKDRAYFARSERGGITLSGGEASAQPSFALEVLRLCREAGVHTALDTCGVASWESLASLYAEVDLVLYDLKEADPERHRRFTGLDNGLVFRNLEKTAELMRRSPMPGALWIRTPIIPGATDREDNLYELGRLLADIDPPRLERWELCAFNNLCADKYRRLGREWAYAGSPLMEATAMEALAAAARRGLAKATRRGLAKAARRGSQGELAVSWTGSTLMEEERTVQC